MPRRPSTPAANRSQQKKQASRGPASSASAPSPGPLSAATAESLAALGLTPLEAEAYRFVLSTPQASGYRIAQALGKPVGNIYKTIESLEAKGAILTSDDGGTRVAAAVPAEEWIRGRRATFDAACIRAARELQSFTDAPEADDDLVYRIVDPAAVFERARSMLRQASRFALASITPRLLPHVADALHACGQRSLAVGVKVYEPCEIPGVETAVDPRGSDALVDAPGEWIILSVDGRACLHALFHPSASIELPTLHMASYTTNSLLAWSVYSGVSSDFLLASVRRRLREGCDAKAIAADLERLQPFESPFSEGKRSLVRRFRPSPRRSVR